MVQRADGKKKSEFLTQTSVLSGAYFDYVANGTNYRISSDNLVNAFGVTGELPVYDSDGVQWNIPLVDGSGGSGRGSIRQAGADTGTPILDQSGSISYIRNVENGAGITSAVSAENGLTLSHNFTVNNSGVPIMINPTSASPTFPSLVAGSGANVQASGNTIVISATGLTTPKTVVVSALSDLPTAVGGVITLEEDTEYALVNDVNVGTNRIVMQELTTITGQGAGITTLTYTGTDAMFTWVDADVTVRNCSVSCANGSLFDGSGPATNRYAFFSNVGFGPCRDLGTVDGIYYMGVSYCSFAGITTDGITLSGDFTRVDFSHSQLFISGGTLFKLGSSTMDSFNASDCLFSPTAGGIGLISGVSSSANINADGIGQFIDNLITDYDMTISNISLSDFRWVFRNNNRIRDTYPTLLLTMQGNATATTIASTSTPVKVAGTWVVGDGDAMTGTTGGRATYNGEKAARMPVVATLTIDPASGSEQDISVYIAKNGTVISTSRISSGISTSKPRMVTCQTQLTFENGDYVEVFVQNGTTVNNVTVTRANLRVG